MSEETIDLKIKKASLKDKDGLILDYDQIIENEDGPVINAINIKGGHKPHQDLLQAFKTLHVHLALICEQVSANNGVVAINPKKDKGTTLSSLRTNVDAYTVTGFSIGGSDENEGVTLIGSRTLSDDAILNLTSPFKKWESEYRFKDDLEVDMGIAIQECLNYINGKFAPNPQLELGLDTDKKEQAA